MPYTALLNKLIEDSGLTVKEIAEKCAESGVKVTPAYISTLRNDENNRTASDTMSRAIAKACGHKNEEILVVEAYVDNAPEAFKGVFDFIREIMLSMSIGMFNNQCSAEEMEIMKSRLENVPLAEIISEMSKQNRETISKGMGAFNLSANIKNDNIEMNAQLNQAIGFDVNDNSMFPTMPKGSKATIEMLDIGAYNNGDILAFLENESRELFYRKVAFVNEERSIIAMFPLNTEFEAKTYNIGDILILGKVKQVITDIK